MKKNTILDYYRNLVLRSSALLLSTLIFLVNLVFFAAVFFFQYRSEQAESLHKQKLAEETLEGLKNTFTMIGKSSHSTIALKYGDFAGYRRVVLPWIDADPRILGFELVDATGESRIQWSKIDNSLNFKKIPQDEVFILDQETITYRMNISEVGPDQASKNYGSIIFYTNLKVTGLDAFGVRGDNIHSGPECRPFSMIGSGSFCDTPSRLEFIWFLIFAYALICALIIYWFLKVLAENLGKRLEKPLQQLHFGLSQIESGQTVIWDEILPKDSVSIFKPLGEHFSSVAIELRETKNQALVNERFGLLAAQVSHDIRSPLSALNMVTASLRDLPEEKRILIRSATQRISDVANNLLQIKKESALSMKATEVPLAQKLELELIPALVAQAVSEKRLILRANPNIQISFQSVNGFSSFAKVSGSELKRVLSNLINNAIEAFEMNDGLILVSVNDNGRSITITVEDNGIGMSSDLLEKVGQLGLSSKSKGDSGSGLGLFHAKQTVQMFHGQLKIESQLDVGTKVIIELPKHRPALWFASAIPLFDCKQVVSLDDDASVHLVWQERLRSYIESGLIHYRCFSKTELEILLKNGRINKFETLFLIDYEMIDQKESGLDLIEELNLSKQSILVTSHYEESHIRQRVEKLGTKMLPKSLVGQVPIIAASSEPKNIHPE